MMSLQVDGEEDRTDTRCPVSRRSHALRLKDLSLMEPCFLLCPLVRTLKLSVAIRLCNKSWPVLSPGAFYLLEAEETTLWLHFGSTACNEDIVNDRAEPSFPRRDSLGRGLWSVFNVSYSFFSWL